MGLKIIGRCDIRDTRFHRGFQRRHQSDIRQDAPRLSKEFGKQVGRDTADRARVDGWHNYKEDYTFNLLNGEGIFISLKPMHQHRSWTTKITANVV